MKKLFLCLSLCYMLSINSYAQQWHWLKHAPTLGASGIPSDGQVAQDAMGNIYVCKYRSYDLQINKYDAGGNLLWDHAYPWSGEFRTEGVTVDAQGNIYAVGAFSDSVTMGAFTLKTNESDDEPDHTDIFILKLDTSGAIQWVKQAGGDHWDEGAGITHDTQGNIYITGTVAHTAYFDNIVSYETINYGGPSDTFIAKYDSNGNALWVERAINPAAYYPEYKENWGQNIVTDIQGNIYVVGSFANHVQFDNIVIGMGGSINLSVDFFIVKFNPNGDALWAKMIHPSTTAHSINLNVDAQGNVFVTGSFRGSSITFNNITLSHLAYADSEGDLFVAKYGPNGNLLWAHLGISADDNDNSTDRRDEGKSIGIDAQGNCYVVGSIGAPAAFDNILVNPSPQNAQNGFVAKYNAYGQIQWVEEVHSTESHVYDILTDSTGMSYLVGKADNGALTAGNISINFRGGFFFARLDGQAQKIQIIEIDEKLVCFPCWPWDIWQDFEYRFWPEWESVRTATYRRAFDPDNRDDVLWEADRLSIQLHDELTSGTYYFQLRAMMEDGSNTDWTETLAFIRDGSVAEVFPNPVQDQLNVRYQTITDETVELKLLNRYGKLLLNKEKSLCKGMNEFSLSIPAVGIHENPLTLQLHSRLQGSFTWQILKE